MDTSDTNRREKETTPGLSEAERTGSSMFASRRSREREPRGRLNLDEDNPKNGIARLLLTLGKFLHELMERQAIRRMDEGTLTEAEIDRLGLALLKQTEELARLQKEFGLEDQDLNLDLGPLGRLL